MHSNLNYLSKSWTNPSCLENKSINLINYAAIVYIRFEITGRENNIIYYMHIHISYMYFVQSFFYRFLASSAACQMIYWDNSCCFNCFDTHIHAGLWHFRMFSWVLFGITFKNRLERRRPLVFLREYLSNCQIKRWSMLPQTNYVTVQ